MLKACRFPNGSGNSYSSESPNGLVSKNIPLRNTNGGAVKSSSVVSADQAKTKLNIKLADLRLQEAEKLANIHLKATIDTGHLNLWRKYYLQDPNLSPEKNEERFKKWMYGHIENLAKKGMVGNIHLTDNLGYEDEHLSPGQGNAPVKEILKIMKAHGYKGPITVEPGAAATTDEGDFYGLMQTWRYMGSSVYGAGIGGPIRMGGPNRAWTDVQSSYFGQVVPPYFIFGSYAPSNDWTLWSGVPLE